jgi:formate dehydrogenase subunit gamma
MNRLPRFSPAARWVHRATAVLGGICLATAAVLYLEPLAELVGRRGLVVDLHVWAGLGLPVPALLGLVSRSVRLDYRRLNRWSPVDREWLRRRDRRRAGLPVGKFNAGQKLNASLSTGGGLVLLGTGIVLEYGRRWPLDLRIGATFVHDWTAAAVLLLLAGHVWLASKDEDARRGMRTGWVPSGWALREHPAWHDQVMDPDQERIRHRAHDLLPEELAAGSDDPEAQAAAILADSDDREHAPEAVEHRTSTDAAE